MLCISMGFTTCFRKIIIREPFPRSQVAKLYALYVLIEIQLQVNPFGRLHVYFNIVIRMLCQLIGLLLVNS